MKKFILTFSFFVITPFVFLFTIVFTLYTSHKFTARTQVGARVASAQTSTQTSSFAALPDAGSMISDEVVPADARFEMVRQFLAKYHSPLLPYAQNIIDAADKYKLDFRLIPAIAMQESGLCKKIPENSFNCWGFGIYGKTVTRFEDYPHGIDIVTKALATRYRQKGLETPKEIMSMYTPSSNGSWAHGVNYFMEELQ